MKKVTLAIVMVFAFGIASAVAQYNSPATGSGSQGTQGSSPSTSQQSQQPGMGTGSSQTGMDQTSPSENSNHSGKGEKKMKGCVQSQGGQYVLETKKGKAVALTGQDVSAHVGHEVAVKGTWENGGNAGMTASSSSGSTSNASSEKAFNVTSVDMISESCSGKNNKGSSGMGAGAAGSSGSGSGAGNSNGGATTPPQ
jgi:hypothetical protein